jgi:hypothetical protein
MHREPSNLETREDWSGSSDACMIIRFVLSLLDACPLTMQVCARARARVPVGVAFDDKSSNHIGAGVGTVGARKEQWVQRYRRSEAGGCEFQRRQRRYPKPPVRFMRCAELVEYLS